MPFFSNAGAGGSGRRAASVSGGLQHVSSGRVVCKCVCVWGVCVERVGREVPFPGSSRMARSILMPTLPPAAGSLRISGVHEGLLGLQSGGVLG